MTPSTGDEGPLSRVLGQESFGAELRCEVPAAGAGGASHKGGEVVQPQAPLIAEGST